MKTAKIALAVGLFVATAGMAPFAYAEDNFTGGAPCRVDQDKTASTPDDPSCAANTNTESNQGK